MKARFLAPFLAPVGRRSRYRAHAGESELRTRTDAEWSRLAQLIGRLDAIVWEADPETWRFTYVSDGAVTLLGLAPARWLADVDCWPNAIHIDDRPGWSEFQRRCTDRAAPLRDFECRVTRADGAVVWLQLIVRVPDEAEPLHRVCGLMVDVTERVRMERALRASEAKYRRISESGIVAVAYADAAGTIVDANDAFLRLVGYDRGRIASGEVSWTRLCRRWRAVAALLERGERRFVAPCESTIRARDGRDVSVLLAVARLADPAGGSVAVLVDIGRRKELERGQARLLAREREARQLAERALRMRDEILGVVAHDLRNPVHTIELAAAAMTQLSRLQPEEQRYVQAIRRAAQGTSRLIRDLLDAGRMEAGTFAIRQDTVNVVELARDIVDLFQPEANQRHIGLRLTGDGAGAVVRGDEDRLRQVLSNLLGNALKFTNTDGQVELRVRRQAGEVELAVCDTGPGIPPEQLPHVFERFWQADRTANTGAGLGLAIARAIVDAHGGRIWAESAPGAGATFRFTLPEAR